MVITPQIEELIKSALIEDIGKGDITTELLIDPEVEGRANLVFKEEGVLAGSEIFSRVFFLLDPFTTVKFMFKDGDYVKGVPKIIANIEGKLRVLLTGERVALNFLQRMSGIATMTRRYVEKIPKNSNTKIVDTRKTTPGIRVLEKYAVRCGGGYNHRFGLDSGILIKDNHIKAVGGIEEAVRAIRRKLGPSFKIEVEVNSIEQVKEAVKLKVDVIMLDNMELKAIKEALRIIGGECEVEVSGNISQEDVEELALLGVNYISVGKITHSAKSIDISLELE